MTESAAEEPDGIVRTPFRVLGGLLAALTLPAALASLVAGTIVAFQSWELALVIVATGEGMAAFGIMGLSAAWTGVDPYRYGLFRHPDPEERETGYQSVD